MGTTTSQPAVTTQHVATVYHNQDGSKTIQLSVPAPTSSAVPHYYPLIKDCKYTTRPNCSADPEFPLTPARCSIPSAFCCSSNGGKTCSTFPVPVPPSCPSGQQATAAPGMFCD